MVDVDSGIPQAKGANFGTYAVVIANENYRSVADVGNAANDGNVLHQYLTKTLGIPENNVIYCENASGAMLADVKGVALEPKKAAPTGNMVVLSACSGSQTAHIFKEGKHGLFTYWLLRKLKETKGEVTLGELQEHLAQYVDYTATNRLNLPGQQPTLQVSPTLSRNWHAIPLR